MLSIVMAGLDPAIHVFLVERNSAVDARHKSLRPGRRSRTRVPGVTEEFRRQS
jgi:hypothetical protein